MPKQGEAATAKGKVEQDNRDFGKAAAGEEEKSTKNALDNLPSNPERKARV